jgi:trans-aconitate methyltransferase
MKTRSARYTTMNCQCDETNVMHFSFNSSRIKGLYMFRALLAHPQEALHIWHLVYFVHMSVGCGTVATDIIHTKYTKCRIVAPPEDDQEMLKTCRSPWFSMNWMKSASRWFHDTDTLWCSQQQQNIKNEPLHCLQHSSTTTTIHKSIKTCFNKPEWTCVCFCLEQVSLNKCTYFYSKV